MRRALLTFVALVFVGGAALGGASAARAASDDPAFDAVAVSFYHQVAADNVDVTRLSESLRPAWTPDAIKGLSSRLTGYGDPTSVAFERKSQQRDGIVYTYRVTTPKAALEYAIGIGWDATVISFSVEPSSV